MSHAKLGPGYAIFAQYISREIPEGLERGRVATSNGCDDLDGAAANRRLAARSFSRWRIRTNSAECRNALAPSQARQEGLPPQPGGILFWPKMAGKGSGRIGFSGDSSCREFLD